MYILDDRKITYGFLFLGIWTNVVTRYKLIQYFYFLGSKKALFGIEYKASFLDAFEDNL